MNRLLAYLATFLMVLIPLEIGLRILGVTPMEPINRFHPRIGWVKKEGAVARRATSEFDVTYTINPFGLRDDPDLNYEKPPGEVRILIVGDSFTLGYTVEPEDLFINILEDRLKREGWNAQVINGGTEGYSTDQELLWLREEGLKYHPDIAILAPYQNDIFWNSQDQYLHHPKPLFPGEGSAEVPEKAELEFVKEQGWLGKSLAIGHVVERLSSLLSKPEYPLFQLESGRFLPKEWGVLLKEEPDFVADAWNRTGACLRGFKATCDRSSIKAFVALIPDKVQIHERAREDLSKVLRVPPNAWSPDLPYERLASLSREAGLDVLDPLPLFRGCEALRTGLKQGADPELSELLGKEPKGEFYFQKDWHFTPLGNRVFALALYRRLTGGGFLGPPTGGSFAAKGSPKAASAGESEALAAWVYFAAAVWLVLGTLYAFTFKDEKIPAGYLKVGILVGGGVGLIHLIHLVVSILPSFLATAAILLVVLAVLGYVLWKLGSRFGTILELYCTFVRRGHWYMVPLLAVMLTIGSLLVVAASSPLVAPFIYTLF